MAIKADSNGFLLGERRLREMAEGIVQTEDNTKQILDVLTKSFKELEKTYQQGNSPASSMINKQNRAGLSQDAAPNASTARTVRKAVDAADQAVLITDEALKTVRTIKKKAIDAVADNSGVSSTRERAEKARERDATGRFIGKNGEKKPGLWSRFKSKLGFGDKGGMEGVDVGGVDPTVDAVRELGSLLSPVKNMGKRVGAVGLKGLRGIWRMSSRMFGRNRAEELPKDQVKANKEAAKSDKTQNKLLKSILSAIWNQGGGGLLGKGGGLLSKLLKGGGGGLLKKVPLLGALLGGGFLAKDWDKLDGGGKGKGIGSIVGMVVGGALGSFLGPVGAVAGGSLGTYLGSIFGEKVGKWTDSLEKQDFASVFKNFLKSVFGFGGGSKSPSGIPYANAGQSNWQKFKGWAGDTLGLGGSTETVGDKIDYSNAPGNKNAAGNVANEKKARQLGMYNALRKAGFTHEQSLAHVGQIGRENSYGDAMFGTHTDISHRNGQKIQNGGVMSWNGDRYKKFAAYMRQQGLMDAQGNMPKTQAVLDAQAKFIKQEGDDPYFKNRMKTFNETPHADPKNMAADMKTMYGWARGQDYVRDKNGNFTIPFDWRAAEARANNTIDSTVPLIKQQDATLKKSSVPAAKGQAQQSILFKPGSNRPAPIQVPAVTPALAKIGANTTAKASNTAPSDQGISQTVADRSLAHVQAGGIGYGQYSA